MSFSRSIAELAFLVKKADIKDPPRVSLTFGSDGDKARFQMELERELASLMMNYVKGSWSDMQELEINGIRIRIL